MEFIRRFSMHILPKAFVRIRHYGILSSTAKKNAIAQIRKQLPTKKIKKHRQIVEMYNPLQCPCCRKESMVRILDFDYRGPPLHWKILWKQVLENKNLS